MFVLNYRLDYKAFRRRINEWDSYAQNHIQGDRDVLTSLWEQSWVRDVYNSCAIENNPMSERNVNSILKFHADQYPAGSTQEHALEVHNLGRALEVWYPWAIDNYTEKIDDTIVKNLHRDIMDGLSPVGDYRELNVAVGDHRPPDWNEVRRQMEVFVEWLDNAHTFIDSPLLTAAAAHVRFEMIHPFIDGNGRTGRALMNMIMLRYGYPPCILFIGDRDKYYHALKFAGMVNDLTPFMRLFLDTLDRWRPE